jgi:hypothetical protein
MNHNEKNTAVAIQLSSLAQYLFPLAGIIVPIIIWSSKKDSSEFIDKHGKSCINFQLSMFLYSFILALIFIPIIIYMAIKNVNLSSSGFDSGNFNFNDLSTDNLLTFGLIGGIAFLIFLLSKIAEFVLIIIASVKASNGELYNYPFTISFFK